VERIPFNRPHLVGTEFSYVEQAIESGKLSGNGDFGARCSRWLEEQTGAVRAFLTPSCTAALEMSTILAGIGEGDEVIMPSYTFVSTATAVAMRGGTPVFVDVREDTLNIDERAIEAAVTDRTKAITVVHYGGVGCEMGPIEEAVGEHGLSLIEDAAPGLLSAVDDRPLGGIGRLGALSFHETKNVHSGEGGALLVNDPDLVEAAEVIQEKGTNRQRFFRGEVDRYTWEDLGSSYLLSEIGAAFLWAQLQEAESLTERRLEIWRRYDDAFADAEESGLLRRPVVPPGRRHNGHTYYLLLPDRVARDAFIADLGERGILAVFHYIPLHTSPGGRRFGRAAGDLPVTDSVSERIVRLPLWVDMTDEQIERVIDASLEALKRPRPAASPARR
jgi:dTDP-4-amino-4,6-dideoxygalactose transaminase